MKQKRILRLTLLAIFLIGMHSCSTEESINSIDEIESIEEQAAIEETVNLVFHYKGVEYPLEVGIDINEEFVFPEIPDELLVAKNKENLATVVSGDQIYLFDNEQSSIEYFSNQKTAKSSNFNRSAARGRSFSVSDFNRFVRAYEHDNFTGKKLNITQGYQLRDLKRIGFNDIMSSIAIDTQYQNIYNGDLVTLYEHKDFKGKSLKFTCETDKVRCHYISGNSNNMEPGRTYRGHRKFRMISFKLFNKWADKTSSIDVKFGGSSVVPRYPSTGGGSSGGGTPRPDPINYK